MFESADLRKRIAWHLLCAAILCLAAACAGQSPLQFAPPAAGKPAATAASTVATVATTATPVATARQPARTNPPAAQPGSATLQVGAKKVEVASVELDPTCKRVVASFDISDNLDELGALATDGLGGMVDDALSKSLAKGSVVRTDPRKQQHQVSKSLRQAAVRMNWLPMAVEVQYGEYQHEMMRNDIVQRDSRVGKALYPVADQMLRDILSKIDEAHGYDFRIFILARSGENAMALPGGLLYLDKALVDDPKLRDKGYFALAHEISHVLQRHETRILQARIIDVVALRGSASDMFRVMRQTRAQDTSAVKLVLGGKLLFEQHYGGQELQSDACAVRLLDRSFGDFRRVNASVQAFILSLPPDESLAKPVGGNANAAALDNVVELVSRPIDRHPGSAARAQSLQVIMLELSKGQSPPGRQPNK